MYRCRKCGKTFPEPELRQKSYFRILLLTIKAQWDSSIDEGSVYEKHCPYCGAGEGSITAFIDQGEYDENNPPEGEDV